MSLSSVRCRGLMDQCDYFSTIALRQICTAHPLNSKEPPYTLTFQTVLNTQQRIHFCQLWKKLSHQYLVCVVLICCRYESYILYRLQSTSTVAVLLWQDQYEKPPCVLCILHSCINKIKFYLSIYLSIYLSTYL